MAVMRDLTREQLLVELRALKPKLESDGVVHLALFGSRARRDNRLDSDIDLVVEIDESRKFSLLDLIGVAHDIEDAIGTQADLLMRRSLDADFLKEVARDEIAIF